MDSVRLQDMQDLLVRMVRVFSEFGGMPEGRLKRATWDDYGIVSAVAHDAKATLKGAPMQELHRVLRRVLKRLKRAIRESLQARGVPDPVKERELEATLRVTF